MYLQIEITIICQDGLSTSWNIKDVLCGKSFIKWISKIHNEMNFSIWMNIVNIIL